MSQKIENEIELLDVVESDELKVGNNFHAFRFKVTVQDDLEELDIIEADEVSVGNNFHAFRFRVA